MRKLDMEKEVSWRGMTAGKHLKNVLGGNFCFDMAQNWVIPEVELPIGSG